jgi:ribosome biogenesis protein Tsr3
VHRALAVLPGASVDCGWEGTMHIPILSERQKHRALPVLLEIEELHVAQCECPDKCQMLRRLREDIAELRAILSKPQPRQSRRHRRAYQFSRKSR